MCSVFVFVQTMPRTNQQCVTVKVEKEVEQRSTTEVAFKACVLPGAGHFLLYFIISV